MLSTPLWAATHGHLNKKLQHVKSTIQRTQKTLHHDQLHHQHLQKKLKAYEVSIQHLTETLQHTQSQLNSTIKNIHDINAQQTKLAEQQLKQQQRLQHIIVKAYSSTSHDRLKNTVDHHSALNQSKLNAYQKYLHHYLHQEYQKLHSMQDTTNANAKRLHQEMTTLTTLRDQLIRQQQRIEHSHQQRQQVLNHLRSKIHNEQDRLQVLQSQQDSLSHLLKKLQQTKRKNAQYFIHHQHRMHWPVKGKQLTKFGERLHHGHLRANGVTIQTNLNAPVKAIAPGIIVFNEWLPGFGLLVIIDHGEGYMSIYGHNARLLKRVGQAVKAGDIISNVGISGGLANPELYFSIRCNGRPLNPNQWCI